MASLVASIGDDGKLITQTTSGDSLTSSSSSSSSTVDSDTFLTLLVAEMQNQDPLEPTSNTEWVAQYAQFTQVETMNEMSQSIDLLRANSLVGKDVIMKVTSASTGDVTYTRGKVEYAAIESNKAILVIDGNKYSLSDLDSVISDEYSEAYDLYSEFTANISSLPDVKYADLTYADKITSLYEQYNFEMDDYQKNFMVTYASSELDTLVNWVAALKNLGVEFRTSATETTESTTTLDEVLESFNTKMDAIIDRLKLLSDKVDANTDAVNNSTSQTIVTTVSSTQTSTNTSQSETNTSTAQTDTTASEDTAAETDTEISDDVIEALVSGTDDINADDSVTDEVSTDEAAAETEGEAAEQTQEQSV